MVNTRRPWLVCFPWDVLRYLLTWRIGHVPSVRPFPEYDARYIPNGEWCLRFREGAGPARPLRERFLAFEASGGVPDGGANCLASATGNSFSTPMLTAASRRSGRRQANGGLHSVSPTCLEPPLVGSGLWGTQYEYSPTSYVYFIYRTPSPAPIDIRVVIGGWRGLLIGRARLTVKLRRSRRRQALAHSL